MCKLIDKLMEVRHPMEATLIHEGSLGILVPLHSPWILTLNPDLLLLRKFGFPSFTLKAWFHNQIQSEMSVNSL